MGFSLSDLLQNDRAGIRRWNARGAATIFHFFLFTHNQNLSAPLSGISAIVPPSCRNFDADDPRPDAIRRHLAWQGAEP
jgi:hypothetical protein